MLEKSKMISENRELIKAALNAYLDKIYSLCNKYFDENDNLKEGLTSDVKAEEFLKRMKNEIAPKLENVREKIIQNDLSFSEFEITYLRAALIFVDGCWEEQIRDRLQARKEIKPLIKILESSETVDN